jgi:small conductance mechanosensitive channel
VSRTGPSYAEIGALLGRAVTIGIYTLSIALVLATLGVNWAALAAVLGAATLGISLVLQDVGRSFVNGVYILIERPFRIGDRVRIGDAEGDVEDVGVRVTRLRTDGGDHVLVPNSVVFSSTIENRSGRRPHQQTYSLTGVQRAIPEIESAVRHALAGHQPIVAVVASRPDGTDVDVILDHGRGERFDGQVIERLHAAFPEATITAKTAAGAS